MAVSLLPADKITQAFIALLNVSFPAFSRTDRGNFNRFCAYVRNQWLPKDPIILSVAGMDDTTNNGLESHHAFLKNEIKVHRPGCWTFVGKLNEIIDNIKLLLCYGQTQRCVTIVVLRIEFVVVKVEFLFVQLDYFKVSKSCS